MGQTANPFEENPVTAKEPETLGEYLENFCNGRPTPYDFALAEAVAEFVVGRILPEMADVDDDGGENNSIPEGWNECRFAMIMKAEALGLAPGKGGGET